MGYKDPAARGTKDGRRSHQPPQRLAELPRAWSKERDGTAGPDLLLPPKRKPREQGPFSRNPSQCGRSKDGQTRSKRQVRQARACSREQRSGHGREVYAAVSSAGRSPLAVLPPSRELELCTEASLALSISNHARAASGVQK